MAHLLYECLICSIRLRYHQKKKERKLDSLARPSSGTSPIMAQRSQLDAREDFRLCFDCRIARATTCPRSYYYSLYAEHVLMQPPGSELALNMPFMRMIFAIHTYIEPLLSSMLSAFRHSPGLLLLFYILVSEILINPPAGRILEPLLLPAGDVNHSPTLLRFFCQSNVDGRSMFSWL